VEVASQKVSNIEFKEPAAKTSEPDLPKYGEDGFLRVTSDFLFRYPQFEAMLAEQLHQNLNIIESAGQNINNFSMESITHAVTENYSTKKFADVVCTEDKSSFLTMLPANHIATWARIKGEIRPAGRNKYAVWTPGALRTIIENVNGTVLGSTVRVYLDRLVAVGARGGDGTINRFKIHPLFFVYASDVRIAGNIAEFDMRDIRQLNPTVSAHMFFRDLNVDDVIQHYAAELTRG
jgi:hypothetical protein